MDIEKKKIGRPKKPIPFELDKSMSVEDAEAQKKIAAAKDAIYKAKIQQVKADEAMKKVISTDVVIRLVTDVFSKFKTILYSATNNLPAQITGKDHAEVTQIMFKFIDDVFTKSYNDFDIKLKNAKNSDEEDEENKEESFDDA